MKPIILNMDEMSDSKEVYDSKPNIFFTIFIYLILAMLAIGFIWMYFGRIDVVVKSEAVLRPNEQVSTVVNEYNGTIEKVYVEDGKRVNKGDILYVINHSDLQTEQNYQEGQLADVKDTISSLRKYKESILDNTNYFEKTGKEEPYYIQFETYYLNYQTMKKDDSYSKEELDLNINTASDQLNTMSNRLTNYKLLKNSIELGKNEFTNSGEQKEYFSLYEKYVSDYQALDKQFDVKKKEIELSTTKEGVVNSLEYYKEQLAGYTTLKKSIEAKQDYFTETSSYSLKYQEYISKSQQLITVYEQAKADYELNVELKDYGVTAMEIKKSQTAMEDADKAIDNYKVSYLAEVNEKITEVNKNIKEMNLQKDNTLSKKTLLSQNEIDRKAALKNYKLQYMTELDSKITELQDSVDTIQDNLDSLELQSDKNYIYKQSDVKQTDSKQSHDKQKEGVKGSIVEYKNKELQTTIGNIDTYEEKKRELEVSLDKVQSAIDSAIVTASASGVVNTNIELVEGDMLAAGTQVLTVIPDGSNLYKVNIYVRNEDIGRIKNGMEIKCNVYALPNTEFGYLRGTIQKVSKDIKVDKDNTIGYYLVEASLEQRTLYDQSGKESILKAGMSCQAQIITENKRILTYVLEKLDLWD